MGGAGPERFAPRCPPPRRGRSWRSRQDCLHGNLRSRRTATSFWRNGTGQSAYRAGTACPRTPSRPAGPVPGRGNVDGRGIAARAWWRLVAGAGGTGGGGVRGGTGCAVRGGGATGPMCRGGARRALAPHAPQGILQADSAPLFIVYCFRLLQRPVADSEVPASQGHGEVFDHDDRLGFRQIRGRLVQEVHALAADAPMQPSQPLRQLAPVARPPLLATVQPLSVAQPPLSVRCTPLSTGPGRNAYEDEGSDPAGCRCPPRPEPLSPNGMANSIRRRPRLRPPPVPP